MVGGGVRTANFELAFEAPVVPHPANMIVLLARTAFALVSTPPALQVQPQASGARLSFRVAVITNNDGAYRHVRRPLCSLHGSRCRERILMATDDDDEAVDANGRFGFQSLLRTCTFVTLWWSLWSLYDLYLTPYSPVPELIILMAFAGYSWSEERKLPPPPGDAPRQTSDAKATSLPTPWPCTTEGCSAEDM